MTKKELVEKLRDIVSEINDARNRLTMIQECLDSAYHMIEEIPDEEDDIE